MADLLLVDNDGRIVELVAWFLERAGHRVRCATSYAEARGLLAQGLPDLLLADLELGAERGIEELPRLAREGLLPRTLVVSGFLDAELRERLGAVPGVVGTLAKPFDLEALEQAIAASLAGGGAGGGEVPAPFPRTAAPVPATPAPSAAERADWEAEGWVEILPDGEVLPEGGIQPEGAARPVPPQGASPDEARSGGFPPDESPGGAR